VHVEGGMFIGEWMWNFMALEWRSGWCSVVDTWVCFIVVFVLVGGFERARKQLDSFVKIAAHLEDIEDGICLVVFVVVGFRNSEDEPMRGLCVGDKCWVNISGFIVCLWWRCCCEWGSRVVWWWWHGDVIKCRSWLYGAGVTWCGNHCCLSGEHR